MSSSDWDDTPGPIVPRFPGQRGPIDLVQCEGCPDQVPARDTREYAGYRLCGECQLNAAERLDRQITRFLATATV